MRKEKRINPFNVEAGDRVICTLRKSKNPIYESSTLIGYLQKIENGKALVEFTHFNGFSRWIKLKNIRGVEETQADNFKRTCQFIYGNVFGVFKGILAVMLGLYLTGVLTLNSKIIWGVEPQYIILTGFFFTACIYLFFMAANYKYCRSNNCLDQYLKLVFGGFKNFVATGLTVLLGSFILYANNLASILPAILFLILFILNITVEIADRKNEQ